MLVRDARIRTAWEAFKALGESKLLPDETKTRDGYEIGKLNLNDCCLR